MLHEKNMCHRCVDGLACSRTLLLQPRRRCVLHGRCCLCRESSVACTSRSRRCLLDIGRDIKHANVFISDDWRPMLGDFGMMGITKRGASDNKLTTTVGTVGWMAPEVLRNPNDQNKKHKFTAERDYDGKKVCLAGDRPPALQPALACHPRSSVGVTLLCH